MNPNIQKKGISPFYPLQVFAQRQRENRCWAALKKGTIPFFPVAVCKVGTADRLLRIADETVRGADPTTSRGRAASTNRISLWILLIASTLIVSACNRQQPLAPPDVQYGQSECADCGMIVSDQRYAAGLILETARGERVPRVFDDIGCMVKYEQHQEEGKVLAHYVKDYNTNQWLTVEQAVLVHRQQIQSPMGYGLMAVADREQASRVANGDAQAICDFATLLNEPKVNEPRLMSQNAGHSR